MMRATRFRNNLKSRWWSLHGYASIKRQASASSHKTTSSDVQEEAANTNVWPLPRLLMGPWRCSASIAVLA